MSVLALLGKRLAWSLAALAVIGMVAAGCATNPVTGEQDLALISEGQEIAMGKANYPKYTQQMNGVPAQDPELQRYIASVGNRLAKTSHRPKVPWEFNVVNHSMVNAYALPGGKISITRGLITNMKNEDELASVMGHEIGHVTARHSVQQLSRTMLVQLAMIGVGVALSDTNYAGLGMMGAALGGTLLLASYSRDQERQSDELGYIYMTKNNYNPYGQVRTFEIFKSLQKSEPGALETMFATHPLTTERITTASAKAQATPAKLSKKPFVVKPFETALARQRERAPAYAAMDKGDKALAMKDFQTAKSHYQKAVALFPGEGLFHTRIAEVEGGTGNYRAAARSAAHGANIRPDLFVSQFSAGMYYTQIRQPKKAIQYLQRADRILPREPGGMYLLGLNYEFMGNRRAAANYYNYVYRNSPNSKAGQYSRQGLYRLHRRMNNYKKNPAHLAWLQSGGGEQATTNECPLCAPPDSVFTQAQISFKK